MKPNLTCLLLFLVPATLAQTNTNHPLESTPAICAVAPQSSLASTNQIQFSHEQAEKMRNECIKGRRSICGKILKILPEGLIVDSGYTNLMRQPLEQSWLVPGAATASRAVNLVESREPGAVCIGLVFLTNPPKSRRIKPKQFDYVIIQGYPAGEYTYKSVGTIERKIRRFSASLSAAVTFRLQAEGKIATPVSGVK